MKVVRLAPASREQQVADGCFPSLELVPERAITLTIPSLLRARRLVCVVPGPRKADAVRATLEGPVGPACPASFLRCHDDAALYLDGGSAARLAPA